MGNKKLLPEIKYTPESKLKNIGQLLREMITDLCNSRELAWRLFVRNISAQYRQTALGYVWAFLPPIVTTATFVFLNAQKIFSVDAVDVPYPVYVMIGTLLWYVFVDAINSPIKIISQSKAMLAKINFPREALILAGLGEVLFNFVIRLILFFIVFFWFKLSFPATIFLAPIGIMAIILLGFTIGILLTPLAILYKDVEQGLMMIMSLWFFLTPVVYPTPTVGAGALLAKLNPITPLLVTTRSWIIGGQALEGAFIFVSLGSLVLIFLGWILYRLAMPHLIARMGS